jgi:HEAT repeat protein
MNRIAEILNIHKDESRMAALVGGVMLFTSAGFTLGSTGIEALLFARLGVQYLPYLYMALGTLSFLTSLGVTALIGRVRRAALYVILPIVLAAIILGGWALIFSGANAVYAVLWLGKEVINSLIDLLVWGMAGSVCDTRQAKRLFPLFSAGRILGSVLGGLSTGALVNLIGTQNLLLVWAAAMLTAYFLGRALMKNRAGVEKQSARARRRQPGLIQEMQKGWQFVRRSALMRWISIAAILFSVLYFSIALPFSKSATIQFANEDALAGFLGLFNAVSTAAAFLASLLLANRLYARFGIMWNILVLPVIYLIGFGALAAYESFAVIVAFRFAQMFWMSGIADSAYQAMFNAVPAERRDQVRAFIGGVPAQAGTFIAGAILIVGEQSFSPQQLYIVGLIAAALITFVVARAGRAYNLALVDALRAGRPTLFVDEAQPFGHIQQDATAVSVTLAGLKDSDPVVRRISAEILGSLPLINDVKPLITLLADPEIEVRTAALKALARPEAASALSKIAALLNDSDADVRAQAIETLRRIADRPSLIVSLPPMLRDPAAFVRARAAVGLLCIGPHAEARDLLRSMSVIGEMDERIHALNAMSEWGDAESLILIAAELEDQHAPAPVRRAAALALAACGPDALPVLLAALSDENESVRAGAALALIRIGAPALDGVLRRLSDPASEDGALLALEGLSAQPAAGVLKKFANERIASALRADDQRRSVATQTADNRMQLLAGSLRARAQHYGLNALKALSLLGDGETINVAIDNLQSRDANQRANALETLESVQAAALIRPLLQVWESSQPSRAEDPADEIVLSLIKSEPDHWLRACAAFAASVSADDRVRGALADLALNDPDPFVRAVASNFPQGESMKTPATLSIMERILLLRRVPLLADLTPGDLKRVAAIASEQHYPDGEVIAVQGEPGEEMYIIVKGTVRVLIGEAAQSLKEFARRKTGEVVGEMSVISGEPRSAWLDASGDVHLLCIDRKSFEGLLRERPEVGLAIMRELCMRLREATK